MRDRKSKKKVVLEIPEIDLSDFELPKIEEYRLPKIEDMRLPKIEDIELPGCPGRGVLVLGLLKNLMPGLKITPKKRYAWIQTFKKMGATEISRIISLSQDENRCRRAIEKAVKLTEK